MRILDKTINESPWAQMTPEQRDLLTSTDNLAPWMFQRAVVLTIVDDAGNQVRQLDGNVSQAKPTLFKRMQQRVLKARGL